MSVGAIILCLINLLIDYLLNKLLMLSATVETPANTAAKAISKNLFSAPVKITNVKNKTAIMVVNKIMMFSLC